MLVLHPNILEKNGVKEFVVLSFDEFQKIKNDLQDFEDLKDLREAKIAEKNVVGLTLSEAKKEWGFQLSTKI
ncbi:Type II toxin-antitoxin system Phd/YefM family antitoxin [Candidatus Magnetomoraceae bacterium gMMP-15]